MLPLTPDRPTKSRNWTPYKVRRVSQFQMDIHDIHFLQEHFVAHINAAAIVHQDRIASFRDEQETPPGSPTGVEQLVD